MPGSPDPRSGDLSQRIAKAALAGFRQLAESDAVGIVFWDREGGITDASPAFCRLVGYERDDFVSGRITWRAITPLEWLPSDEQALRELEATGVCTPFEKEFVHRGGRRVRVLMGASAVGPGSSQGVCFVVDLSGPSRAEETLRESELRSRALIENSSEGVITMDATGRILYANPAALQAIGYAAAEVVGTSLLDHVHPEDAEPLTALFTEVLAHPERRAGSRARGRHKDGSYRSVEGVLTNLLEVPGVRGVALHFHDVTESQAIQQRLAQADRMEAIGRLAGGVAHDFNNLLTAIVGHAELLRDILPAGSDALEDLAEIEKAAGRAAALTQQLLAFSRRQVLQPQVLDLNVVVEGMRRMLERLIGEHIHLVFRPGRNLAHVRADPSQMEQVLLNLVVNARDAMPQGGSIVIETANRELDEWYARRHGSVAPGSYVLLTVTDTGHGIDRAARDHIFEPFFTTRTKGTGLGLATVYGVISQSGGHITVDSESGVGTTFAIFLPRVDQPAEPPVPEVPRAGGHGTETVLVVEDETVVRDLAAKVLRQAGYTVLTAENGEQAVTLVQRQAEPIQLVLSDVVMPGLSGPQTVDRLQALRPGLRVLYMSGYTDEAMLEHGLEQGTTPFLPKPFTPWSLTAKVREVLDATSA